MNTGLGLKLIKSIKKQADEAKAKATIFFNDKETANKWVSTHNFNLGDSPINMIISGRGDKLMSCMNYLMGENKL